MKHARSSRQLALVKAVGEPPSVVVELQMSRYESLDCNEMIEYKRCRRSYDSGDGSLCAVQLVDTFVLYKYATVGTW